MKSFEKFAQSTIKPFSTITGADSRPMSGLQSSQSTSGLKKTSMIRCKTALNKNTMSHTNLLTAQQQIRISQGFTGSRQISRNNLSSKKVLQNLAN